MANLTRGLKYVPEYVTYFTSPPFEGSKIKILKVRAYFDARNKKFAQNVILLYTTFSGIVGNFI